MPLKRNDIHSSLNKKGFTEVPNKDHTYFVYFTVNGKKSHINTKTSHGTNHKDIGDPIIAQMAKQLKLTNKQFRDLVGCSIDRADYEQHLVQAGEITIEQKTADGNKSENENSY